LKYLIGVDIQLLRSCEILGFYLPQVQPVAIRIQALRAWFLTKGYVKSSHQKGDNWTWLLRIGRSTGDFIFIAFIA
jgi:hypothetical protein